MWLYDPRTNLLEEMMILDKKKNKQRPMKMAELAERFDYKPSSISRAIDRLTLLTKIGCYAFKEKPSRTVRRALYEKQVFDGELWRKHAPSGLFVSNYGRVKQPNGNLLMPMPKKPQMHRYVLVKEGGKRTEFILRNLVAECFLGKKKPGMCVTYRTIDVADCSVWNIKYETIIEVQRKAVLRTRAKPVVRVDERTLHVIDYWQSAIEATRANHFSQKQSIVDRCNGKNTDRSAGWFMWETDYDRMMDELDIKGEAM